MQSKRNDVCVTAQLFLMDVELNMSMRVVVLLFDCVKTKSETE